MAAVAGLGGAWMRPRSRASMGAGMISKAIELFRYPEYDICEGPFLDECGAIRQFDLILANQVWEHLDRPYAATCNVLEMLRPGGYFWIAVPFFIPYHARAGGQFSLVGARA